MKKTLISLAIAAMAMSATAQTADPVLMTVAGKPVYLSEFEYLYQKNNAQQMSTQPVDEYLDMFVVYKLKVADAEAQGLDKTPAFLTEYEGYVNELSEPYLADTAARDSIVNVIYTRLHDEADVSHIMVERPYGASAAAAKIALLDSIRNEVIAGRAEFGEMADRFSIDPAVRRNHGHMGIVNAASYPSTFEDAAWQTPVGQISDVIATPFGYHIVMVNDRRPNSGQVKVQHILKMTHNLSPAQQAKAKQEIDSIYALLQAGADFSELAMAESQDPGSARNGGQLDWFGRGRMVPEFEEVSFSLGDGEISEPFATSYGYHIVKRLEWKPIDSFENVKGAIDQYLTRDERNLIPVRVKTAKLRGKYGVAIDPTIADELRAAVSEGIDSTVIARYANDNRVLVATTPDNGTSLVSAVFAALPANFNGMAADNAATFINQRLEEMADNLAIAAERNHLAEENPEYRNLLNEYRDGMLLFEVSDRNVWSRAKADPEGLAAYFDAHRAEYSTWTEPHYKGYVVFAVSEELMNEAREFLNATNPSTTEINDALREKFGRDVKAERVLAGKGENAIIDGLVFGGIKPDPTTKWAYYFAWGGKIIDQPEEAADVRGAVVTDYQGVLENAWVDQLRSKYPVTVYREVLETIQ